MPTAEASVGGMAVVRPMVRGLIHAKPAMIHVFPVFGYRPKNSGMVF